MLRYGRTAAEIVPLGLVVAVWVIAMAVVYPALTHAEPFGEHGLDINLWTWIPAGDFTVQMGFHVDALTAALLIVVTTIGMLVHLYSVGYMAHDKGTWRFFAYLNLFMFSMLLLVLANNWLLVFAGWELVGLSSYSLIGFWYHKRSAALAAKKAFIVNRVGDVGFALGIMAIFVNTGTMNIQESLAKLTTEGASFPIPITIVALLVFAGAMGKSAQFPLHVWLPDAMEGPTPVSALIHAATMVNAGVYLVARANPLFAHAQEAMVVVAAIGIFTAILAASIAFTQTDIKRVLAYSTLSQLGYMFAALGVGAYVAAIFHLMTHGFFKGLLFLGSGSVIHAVHEEQDMNRMGGLWRKIPITHWTMLVGSIAIAGIPPLAGFFSKDEILGEAFKFGFTWVWLIGLVVAGMTAFYMWRLMGRTFYGESRVDPHTEPKVHESAWQMTVPLILLAIPAALLGLALTWGGPPLNPEGTGLLDRLARARVRGVGGASARRQGGLRAVRDRRHPDHRQRGRGHDRPGRRLGPVRVLQPTRPAGDGGRHRCLQRPDAIPVPGHPQQVVVRRDQRPAVHPDRRTRRRDPVVVRPHDRRWHRQRGGHRRPRRGRRAAADPDRPRPELRAGHRDRPAGDGRLVPPDRGAVPMTGLDGLPLVTLVTFLPALGALAWPSRPRPGQTSRATRRWGSRWPRGSSRW